MSEKFLAKITFKYKKLRITCINNTIIIKILLRINIILN